MSLITFIKLLTLPAIIFVLLGCNGQKEDWPKINKEDIVSIVIVQDSTDKTLNLEGRKLDTIKSWIESVFSWNKPRVGTHPHEHGIAADFAIIVTLKDASKREFAVYGNAVLRDEKTGEMLNDFYAGYIINDWLKDLPVIPVTNSKTPNEPIKDKPTDGK